jgi:hypothetical protein
LKPSNTTTAASGLLLSGKSVAGVTVSVATLSADGGWVAFDEYTTEQDPEGGPGRLVTRVRVHSVPGGAERATLHFPAGAVRALAFSADGRWLAVYSGGSRLGVYESATGRALPGWPLQGPAMMPGVAAYSPDGRLLAAADREQVKVWEVASGQELLALRGAPPRSWDPAFNPRLAWSPDGRRLAASNWDQTVSVWDAAGPDPADRAARRHQAEGRAGGWHRRELLDAEGQKNSFATAFHRKCLEALAQAGPAGR